MDKNEKLLKKLSPKEFQAVMSALEALLAQNTSKLDIKKLQGHTDVFRVRVGSIRIIFLKKPSDTDIEVLEISRRSEKTYRKF